MNRNNELLNIISSAFLDTEEINENTFYLPLEAEYIDFEEDVEEWDVAAERPGLWENIRRKKEREGKKYKPAKVGDKDRPSKDAWKKSGSKATLQESLKTLTWVRCVPLRNISLMQPRSTQIVTRSSADPPASR